VELRHLEYFVAVAAELSFTRASRRLHVVQSGVSSAIQGLERELGATLFDRNRHRVTLTEAGLALLPALLKRNGVDADKVKILRVEGAGKMVAIAEKRAEAIMSGLDNQSLTLAAQGVPITDFGYAANGVNTVGLTIHANRDTLASNPDLVRRFVKATIRSFEAAIKDPDASIKAGQKVKPDLDTALSLAQFKVGIGLIKSPASKDLPPGQFAAKDWADTVELMKTYQDLQTDLKPEEFYTNEFVPASKS